MSAPTIKSDHQVVNGPDGRPLYYLIPVEEYEILMSKGTDETVSIPTPWWERM